MNRGNRTELHGARKVRLALLLWLFATAASFQAAPIPVIERQGSTHGFLILEDENHKEIAVGDQTYFAKGNTVRSRLLFRFKDGSVDDETAVFRQGTSIQLVSDHHIQSGPSFPKPLDLTIDVPKATVTWVETSDKGKKTNTQHVYFPPDLVNGIVSLTIENFTSKSSEMDVSYVVLAPKPRVVKFVVKRDGEDRVMLGSMDRKAERFNIHIELGGVAGVVAPLVGKQPPDFKMWTLGELPVFIRMTGPLYEEGPAWTIAWAAPSWGNQETR